MVSPQAVITGHGRIWASRPGVAKADVVEESHYMARWDVTPHDDHVVVDVSITADFDPRMISFWSSTKEAQTLFA